MKITTMIAATMIMLIAPHHAAAQQPSDFEIKLQNCKTEALMAEMPGKTRWNSCGQTVPPTPPDALSAKNKASAKRCWTNGRHERTRTPPPAWKKLSIHNEPTFETPRTSSARRLQVRHAARAAARDGDAPGGGTLGVLWRARRAGKKLLPDPLHGLQADLGRGEKAERVLEAATGRGGAKVSCKGGLTYVTIIV
jgi:hypothetical protein